MTHAEAVLWDVREGASHHDWVRAHAALTRLARERAAADAEEGRWLLAARRSGAHVFLGFGSFSEYVERLLGYSPRATREKLRVAEALEGLPLSARALERGELSWCAARELTRVASGDTEAAWLEAGRGKTTRELERLVAGKQPGALPPQPTEPPRAPRRHILRFEVAPETFATFREAARSLRRAAGGDLDDDAVLLAMARHVLGAPPDERSSYRLSFQMCGACGQGSQVAAGELIPVDAEVLAMAACDGERVGAPSVCPANENRSAPDARARAGHSEEAPELATEHVASAAPSAAASDADPTSAASSAAPASAASSAAPASAASSAAPASAASDADPTRSALRASHMGRARQAVPPAVRRAVLARDRHRCQVPGCTHVHFVDVHHIRPRSEGGRNTLENLITLCTAHHRATHRGELIVERTGADLAFCHADGTAYGQPLRADSAEAYAKIFSSLRHLGFREREVRGVLAELRADASLCVAPTAQLLAEALRRIRPVRG